MLAFFFLQSTVCLLATQSSICCVDVFPQAKEAAWLYAQMSIFCTEEVNCDFSRLQLLYSVFITVDLTVSLIINSMVLRIMW